MSDIPVICASRTIKKLSSLIDDEEWDDCITLSNEVCKQVRLAIHASTSMTGTIHLDGVYRIGTMYYQKAPPKVRRSLNKMNRIIKRAKGSIK